eukprot:TRINITY_DN61866_c0_g1_i3.p1 TRINITY_DN61866_c0_g1~~TRINITY_DN61866_c0_g1_i3.p1  ORF type:complete len:456 (-),score=81.00 TRINITY_DN61866_c0_g1_i3:215-1486(-)
MPVRLHSRRRRQYYAVQNARGVKAANSASGWKAQSSRVDILHGQWCRAPRKQRFVSRLLTHLRDALAFAAGLKKVSPAADDMEDDDPWEEPAVPDIEPSNTGCDGKVRGCSVCGHWRKVAQYGGVRAPWLCAACWLEGDQAAAVGMTTLTSSNPYTKVPVPPSPPTTVKSDMSKRPSCRGLRFTAHGGRTGNDVLRGTWLTPDDCPSESSRLPDRDWLNEQKERRRTSTEAAGGGGGFQPRARSFENCGDFKAQPPLPRRPFGADSDAPPPFAEDMVGDKLPRCPSQEPGVAAAGGMPRRPQLFRKQASSSAQSAGSRTRAPPGSSTSSGSSSRSSSASSRSDTFDSAVEVVQVRSETEPVQAQIQVMYARLRQRRASTVPERKEFFMEQCRLWHPDKNLGNEETAKQIFQLLQEKKSWFLAA